MDFIGKFTKKSVVGNMFYLFSKYNLKFLERNRESSFDYLYNPSQFFNDNPQFKANLSENNRCIDEFRNVKPIQVSLPNPSFIDDIYLRRSLKGIDKNPLFKWISGWFGIEDSMKLFDLYKVGTSVLWGGSTVFWQIDLQNKDQICLSHIANLRNFTMIFRGTNGEILLTLHKSERGRKD